MPVECRCEQCGKVFYRSPSLVGRFCSYQCKSASQRKEVTVGGVGVLIPATCIRCGTVFETRRRRPSQFCSHSCAAQHHNEPLKIREMRVCQQCGKEFEPNGSPAWTPGIYCSRACMFESRRRPTKKNRYPRRTVDGQYVRLHRQVVEERIGRKLLPSEVVHHLDEDKHNWHLANLVVLTRSAHSHLHGVLYKMEKAGVRRK